MINNKMISSNTVIAKAIADLGIQEDQIKISDWKDWIIEAMLKIGAIQQFEHKIVILPIEGHQVSLPCDLYRLDQVAYSGTKDGSWSSMRKSTSSFGVFHDKKHDTEKPEMLIKDNDLLPLVKNMFNLVSDEEAIVKLNEDINLRQTLSTLVNQGTDNTVNRIHSNPTLGHQDSTMYSNDLQYMTKPGYIMTNAPSGWVKISYYAIYTDEESMPMIPDLESYKEAIMWYIAVKHFYPQYLNGKLNREIYYDMKRSWSYYRKQAYGEAITPGVDDMESIKNNWHKLYPEINEHDTFFSTMGEEQIIYNHNV